VSVVASLKAESLRGARVEARGLLYREPAAADLNLTSLTSIAPRCRN
jgi:hypothetical protein